MKEVKYVSNFLRNIYLLVLFVISVNLIRGYELNIIQIVYALFTYLVGYTPTYFLNDFMDRKEDKKFNRSNLYTEINNENVFWGLTILLTIFGIFLTIRISYIALIFLFLLYIFNIIYSLKPLRLRDKAILREINIFIIYIVKVYFFGLVLFSSINVLPLPIIVMSAATGALSVSLYKRYSNRVVISEIIFGIIFIIFWILTEVLYKQTFLLFLPLLPALLFLSIKYKKEQIPIGIYQTVYFVYTLLVYFFVK